MINTTDNQAEPFAYYQLNKLTPAQINSIEAQARQMRSDAIYNSFAVLFWRVAKAVLSIIKSSDTSKVQVARTVGASVR